MVQHRTILAMADDRKSYKTYRTAPFSMILNDPYPGFKVTPFFDPEYLKNGATHRHSLNTNRDLHIPYSTVSFRMSLSDLE